MRCQLFIMPYIVLELQTYNRRFSFWKWNVSANKQKRPGKWMGYKSIAIIRKMLFALKVYLKLH